MGEIHLVAESIIPQDKGSWDRPRCVTGGQEVAEGQVPDSPAQGTPRAPTRCGVGFVQLATHVASKQ